MDQSKARIGELTDQELRYMAIQLALTANSHPQGNPSKVVENARVMYKFLNGSDPVLDARADPTNILYYPKLGTLDE